MIFCLENSYVANVVNVVYVVNVFVTTAATVTDSSRKISTELDLELWFCFSECEVSAHDGT